MTAEICLTKHFHRQESKRGAHAIVVAFNIGNRAGKAVIVGFVQREGIILRIFCRVQRCFNIERNFFTGFIHATDIQEDTVQSYTKPNTQQVIN